MAGYLFMCLFSVKIFPPMVSLAHSFYWLFIFYLLVVISYILRMLCHMYKKYFFHLFLSFFLSFLLDCFKIDKNLMLR